MGFFENEIILHFFNLVWSNIFENSFHIKKAFFNCVDCFRISLGSPIVFNYTIAGLFHPSKKVRKVYWNIFNILYIGSQHRFVVCYPSLSAIDEEENNLINLLLI